MKEITQQKRDVLVVDEIELERRIQVDVDKRDWRNRRYDYYCGDWRYDCHEEQKIEEAGKILV